MRPNGQYLSEGSGLPTRVYVKIRFPSLMLKESKLDLIRKQLEVAKAAESAALSEFLRYDTPHYEKEWELATEKVKHLADRLSNTEIKLLKKVRRSYRGPCR